ncbi:MAG: hypothetical protein GEU71_10905 [Actinobacteria bacterium]|nr:hypothetical protein [Actinomycetota bacterium]
MAKAQEIFYATVGASEFALEKVKGAGKLADKKVTQKYYKDFVKRGKTLSTKVKNSGPTKKAIAQTKTARAQVKAAATSVTKAVRADAKATKPAATKTAKAS